ncbi:DMT family transporter [Trinickia violacea]|uniref:DMT family transporter n=1 Tax=Trinickia violacea TaxID=2571746 RepID=A0A4P8ILV7_9BURK|nr:DMT family transporter [Trinickia violacea]QCP49912.1 DMT family transporter [Trinickia violacea]
MSHRYRAYLCLALAMTTVGSTVVASKVIGTGFSPFAATALRFAIALPVFAALMVATRTAWPKPDRHDRLLLLAQAAAGSVGYTVFLIAGTKLTSAADAGIMVGTLPAVAAIAAAVLLREPLAPKMLLSIGLATAGVLVVATDRGGPAGAHSLAGDGLILMAVFCESVFILLNKRLRVPLSPLALSTTMAALGLATSLPFALWDVVHGRVALDAAAFLGVAYYALVPTVLGFWLWYAGSARVSGAEASLFTAVAPVAAVVLSSAWLGERVGMPVVAGLMLVIAAVALTALPELRRRVSGP